MFYCFNYCLALVYFNAPSFFYFFSSPLSFLHRRFVFFFLTTSFSYSHLIYLHGYLPFYLYFSLFRYDITKLLRTSLSCWGCPQLGILLPQSPRYWDYGCAPLCPINFSIFTLLSLSLFFLSSFYYFCCFPFTSFFCLPSIFPPLSSLFILVPSVSLCSFTPPLLFFFFSYILFTGSS